MALKMREFKFIQYVFLVTSSIAVYMVSGGVDFSDSINIIKWMIDREIQGYDYLSFLDFYALFGEDSNYGFIVQNLIILLLINILIVNIGISSFLIYFYLSVFSCLLGLITKELFFLLGFLVLLITQFYDGKKLLFLILGYGLGSYILLITKPLLGLIYIVSFLYVILANKLRITSKFIYYGILIISCILLTKTNYYNNMETIYFGQSLSGDFNKHLSGHSIIATSGRFIANIASPVYNIDSISGLDSYQLYVSIAAVCVILRLIWICNSKNKNCQAIDGNIRYVIVLNIIISVLIPFVQTRYLLPGLIILFLKPKNNL